MMKVTITILRHDERDLAEIITDTIPGVTAEESAIGISIETEFKSTISEQLTRVSSALKTYSQNQGFLNGVEMMLKQKTESES